LDFDDFERDAAGVGQAVHRTTKLCSDPDCFQKLVGRFTVHQP
jgi:hypothetical protein